VLKMSAPLTKCYSEQQLIEHCGSVESVGGKVVPVHELKAMAT
jgi:hypothetical protein